ncbi:MAG: endonuclease/exonuclease/phosphatase family protein [Labilithrix sp.]|nr:endonuclease/exonuclease/phosphatase family protein [Labilithrix sp.]
MRQALYVAALAIALGCGTAKEAALTPPGPLTLMSVNIASGAGDRFRTADHRVGQGAFVARSSAEVVGLQEVDVGVDRSGDADTAARVAAAASPGFATCAFAVVDPPHLRGDGTRLARCEAGAIVFGVGFRGDDPFAADDRGTPSGIMDGDDSLNPTGVDRGADALYGNALIVAAPWEVEATYTVALPMDASGPRAPDTLLDRLARESPDVDAIAALAAHNDATRRRRGIEPRSALVARIRKPGTTALSVITTHLESAGPSELRGAQLDALVAIARVEQQRNDHRVVVLGDFNMPSSEARPALAAAGFVLAAPTEAAADIDQIWVDATLVIDAATRAPTDGASDHAYAPIATVR